MTAYGRGPITGAIDLGDVAILPGFVNAHAHLDLCDSPGLIWPGMSLEEWLPAVVAARRNAPPPSVDRMASVCREMIDCGTTLLGDIATAVEALVARRKAGLPGVTFFEVVGLRETRWAPLWEMANEEILRAEADGEADVAASLHAPYSTARTLFEQTGTRLVAVHWLESAHERRLLAEGQGPLRDFLLGLGAADPELLAQNFAAENKAPAWFLDRGRWLLVHANFPGREEIEKLAAATKSGAVAGVVHCPRTHAAFGHPRHPATEFAAAGVTLALGTDSLASNPDMDVFGEAKFLAACRADLDPETLLAALTTGGAKALGRAREWDWDREGAEANFTLVEVPAGAPAASYESLFAPASRAAGTMIRGRWRSGPVESGASAP
ncbi:MAG TPA: amidohydrolase family protein [Planctomycetia bacterium]|nr:amidohydrolase family protein [Planctomycetia bacterium]